MINKTKKVLAVLSMIIFGSALLYNCEPEIDNLGEQFFEGQGTTGTELSEDLIVYNIDNNDSIRADYSRLASAVIGAYSEPQFGLQTASYFTQIRMSSYDPDFGTNAVIDSVVLVLKPNYETSSDSLVTTTNESYVYPDGNADAKLELKKVPVTKYGKTKTGGSITPLTLKVHEVTEFMGSYNDKVFSNKNFTTGAELGSKVFDGYAKSVTITKDANNEQVFASTNDIRIPLDKAFFQNKIIAKKDQSELQNMSNFIRYFRGLKVSIQENNGYLFSINPNDTGTQIIMYYKYDKVDNGTTTRPQTTFSLSIGAGNAHTSLVEYDRSNSEINNYLLGNQNTTKLYAQGMGGPSIGIKFKPETINKLKNLYQNNKAAIVSAKIRLYTDAQNWNNSLLKPAELTFVQKDKDETTGKETTNFTSDYLKLIGTANYIYLRTKDLDKNPGYYEFTVTQSIKDIVEGGVDYTNKYFKIDIAQFYRNSDNTTFSSYSSTTRVFAKERVVFVGSDPSNDKKIQLKVIYGSK